MMRSRTQQAGFSLIESLIAMLVIAIALLAMGGLQLNSLRSTGGSMLRTIATQQAYDIADRARANLPAYRAGAYAGTGAIHAACFAAGCSPQQQAEMDLYLWNQSNASMLPSGQGVVCIDSTPNDGTPGAPACDNVADANLAVKIWWDDDRSGSANQRFVQSVRP
ncbi:MAG: type IV pilus modification protein PilV [Burkholderiales bacterium]|nr:MAG: type IV pilus modification protein PilV [Burkholderiales bacterium]